MQWLVKAQRIQCLPNIAHHPCARRYSLPKLSLRNRNHDRSKFFADLLHRVRDEAKRDFTTWLPRRMHDRQDRLRRLGGISFCRIDDATADCFDIRWWV